MTTCIQRGAAEPPQVCGGCRIVRFCSPVCQRSAWGRRRAQCSANQVTLRSDAHSATLHMRSAPQQARWAGCVPQAVRLSQFGASNRATKVATSEGPWLVLQDFVTEGERLHLHTFAQMQRASGLLRHNPAGPHRFYRKLDAEGVSDPLLEELSVRLEAAVRGLAAHPRDTTLGRVCSWIESGGFIHEHTDRYPQGSGFEGRGHLRANVVVQMQPASQPIIAGKPAEVSNCDAWIFLASHEMHSTALVRGLEPRIVFGFGWTVPGDFVLAAA